MGRVEGSFESGLMTAGEVAAHLLECCGSLAKFDAYMFGSTLEGIGEDIDILVVGPGGVRSPSQTGDAVGGREPAASHSLYAAVRSAPHRVRSARKMRPARAAGFLCGTPKRCGSIAGGSPDAGISDKVRVDIGRELQIMRRAQRLGRPQIAEAPWLWCGLKMSDAVDRRRRGCFPETPKFTNKINSELFATVQLTVVFARKILCASIFNALAMARIIEWE